MSRSGASFSRNRSCAVTVLARSSSMTPRTKTTPSFRSREKMSYARSPLPSLVMTVGMRVILGSPPWFEADAWSCFGRRVGHGQVSAEVGDAPQRLHRKPGGGESQLHRGVFRPAAMVRVGAEQPREVGVNVGGSDAQRMRDGEPPLGRHLLPPPLD